MAQTLDQARKQNTCRHSTTNSTSLFMAKLRVRSSGSSSSKKKGSGGGIVKLKIVVEKLQRSLSLGRHKPCSNRDKDEAGCDSTCVPEDVKKGHFAVIAEGGEEPKRFVLPLSCLTNPTFLRLLEQAAEEYGFDREGALTIPCRPSELERILAQQWQEEKSSETAALISWTSCNESMVQIY